MLSLSLSLPYIDTKRSDEISYKLKVKSGDLSIMFDNSDNLCRGVILNKRGVFDWLKTPVLKFLDPSMYAVLFYKDIIYKFYIAANPSLSGAFLHICIICRFFHK